MGTGVTVTDRHGERHRENGIGIRLPYRSDAHDAHDGHLRRFSRQEGVSVLRRLFTRLFSIITIPTSI
jgi:hypothetical protein